MKRISEYSSAGFFPDPIMSFDLNENEMLILIYSYKRDDISPGKKMKFKNYRIPLSDEFGSKVEYDALTVINNG